MNHKRSVSFFHLISTTSAVLAEVFRAGRVAFRLRASLVAGNLFLRKQSAFHRERQVSPRRLTDPVRLLLILWSLWFEWKNGLVVVKPETFIGWHRRAIQLLWRWKSRGGRPRLPKHLCALIVEMVRENPTWGEARVALELALTLGIQVLPRTVRAYWPQDLSPNRGPSSAVFGMGTRPMTRFNSTV